MKLGSVLSIEIRSSLNDSTANEAPWQPLRGHRVNPCRARMVDELLGASSFENAAPPQCSRW